MSADQARITTARQLLTQLGLTIADLYCQDTADRAVPTLAEYLPQVIAAAGPGATRTYGSYWTKMAMAWGSRALDEISATRHRSYATSDGRHRAVAAQQPPRPSRRRTCDRRRPRDLQPRDRRRADPSSRQSGAPGRQTPQVAQHPAGADSPRTRTDQHSRPLERQRRYPRCTPVAFVHRNSLPSRRGAGTTAGRSRHRTMPGPTPGEGQHPRWQPISPALAHSLADHATHRSASLPTDRSCGFATGAP